MKERLAKQLVGDVGTAEQSPARRIIQAVFLGFVERLDDSRKIIGALSVILGDEIQPAHFQPEHDLAGGGLVLGFEVGGLFVKLQGPAFVAVFGQGQRQPPQQQRIVRVLFHDHQGIAHGFGRVFLAERQGDNLAQCRHALGIETEGPFVEPQSAVEILPLFGPAGRANSAWA